MTDMSSKSKRQRIAIVYDWIDKWGGVERVLLELHELFPDAIFFTSAYDATAASWAQHLPIQTTFLQHIPSWLRSKRALMILLYPIAFETFDFSGFDLVISVTSSFAKSIVTKPETKHICYLLTPPRYIWSHTDEYIGKHIRIFLHSIIRRMQKEDVYMSKRPDAYISISQTVANRCKDCYGVTSPVVYPPFDAQYWATQKIREKKPVVDLPKKEFYLWVGRMESYKRVELIIEAANKLPEKQFVLVGVGSQKAHLQKMAGKNCFFTGSVSDAELAYVYSRSHALLMPQQEDFGYVSLEAQFFGCPVIAYGRGGAVETVIHEKTGLLFYQQTSDDLVATLERYRQISYNLRRSVSHLQKMNEERFGKARFQKDFLYQLQQKMT